MRLGGIVWMVGMSGARLLASPPALLPGEGLALGTQLPQSMGDPEALALLEPHLKAALAATEAFGPLPSAPWKLHLHTDAALFERATGAPPQRAAAWVGATLHLRPWEQLQRRELGSLLRHELVHRRLLDARLRRWEEEARCLWAEGHVRPPEAWPAPPEEGVQAWLDRALTRGTTDAQALAYRWIRAWVHRHPLPSLPPPPLPKDDGWRDLPPEGPSQVDVPTAPGTIRVVWPPERLPARMVVNGQELRHRTYRFEGMVRFSGSAPIQRLEGRVELQWTRLGWRLTWHTSAETWVAAALAGELGSGPPEAQRALAAILHRWLLGHPNGNHPDGSLCPLTHCAVVRGQPDAASIQAARMAPPLSLDPRWAFFHGSAGGHSLSPREVWGKGPDQKGRAEQVPEDRWATWTRTFTPAQVQRLKREVRPGVRPGQRGFQIGASGPYAVEDLRLAAGRAFGWTAWPSNVCDAWLSPEGSLRVEGRGWGHHVGLCLASAIHWAKQGWAAEQILEAAFGPLLRTHEAASPPLSPPGETP